MRALAVYRNIHRACRVNRAHCPTEFVCLELWLATTLAGSANVLAHVETRRFLSHATARRLKCLSRDPSNCDGRTRTPDGSPRGGHSHPLPKMKGEKDGTAERMDINTPRSGRESDRGSTTGSGPRLTDSRLLGATPRRCLIWNLAARAASAGTALRECPQDRPHVLLRRLVRQLGPFPLS